MSNDALESHDPRYHAITTLQPGPGVVMVVGTVPLLGAGRPPLDFPIPSFSALALCHARRAGAAAKKIASALEVEPTPGRQGGVTPKSDRAFFDLIEMKATEVIMAYTAVEAFANELIPDGAVHREVRKGAERVLDKAGIERHLNLGEKLAGILPGATGVKSPKGTEAWRRFRAMEVLRNRLVHAKSADRQHRKVDEKSLWEALLGAAGVDFSATAHDIIGHYLPNKDRRWHRLFPAHYPE